MSAESSLLFAVWQRSVGVALAAMLVFFVLYRYGAYFLLDLMLVIGLGMLLFRWRGSIGVLSERESRTVYGAVLLFFVLNMVTVVWYGDFTNPPAENLYHIAVIPLLVLVLARFDIDERYFWWGVALAALVAGVVALSDVVFAGKERAEGLTRQAIVFGNISLMFGFFSLMSAVYFRRRFSSYFVALPLIAAFCGFMASLLSGSRGGWLFVPVGAILLMWIFRRELGHRPLIKWIAAALALALAVAGAIFWNEVGDRLGQAVTQAGAYLSGAGGAHTSIGLRFEMWKAALHAISESPWVGVGIDGFHHYLGQFAAQGKMVAEAASFDHAHNQFLHTWATAGTVGLIGLLALFLLPLKLFLAGCNSQDMEIKALAASGVLLVVGFATFCLTDSLLFVRHSGNFYFASLVTIAFLLARRQRQLAGVVPGDGR